MCRRLIYLVSFAVPMQSLIGAAQAGEATADTFVRGADNGDTNYGAGGSVTLKNTNGNSYDRKGYIRFDVADVVSEASLVLTVSTNNEGGGGTTPQTFTIEVYGLADPQLSASSPSSNSCQPPDDLPAPSYINTYSTELWGSLMRPNPPRATG